MKRHVGRVTIVTGASSGLGQSTAQVLAAEGATVIAVGRDEARLNDLHQAITTEGGRCHVAAADLLDPDAPATIVRTCHEVAGAPNALVNVAGSHTMRHTTSTTDQDWELDLALNLTAPFRMIRAVLPTMLETGGAMVNVASIAGLEAQPYSAGYCAAKHGLVGLTRSLALEYIDTRLRINAICPGGMDTPQVQQFTLPDDADLDLVLATSARRGLSPPADVADVISFLLSDQARAIHGAIYPVDNGKMA